MSLVAADVVRSSWLLAAFATAWAYWMWTGMRYLDRRQAVRGVVSLLFAVAFGHLAAERLWILMAEVVYR